MMSDSEVIETPAGPARLKRTRRKTLAISVLPDGTIELVAPEEAPMDQILQRVGKRLGWIGKQRRDFVSMQSVRPARRYVSGASHHYLGRQYRLKVEQGKEGNVVLKGGYFFIRTPVMEDAKVSQLLEGWYRGKAREQFGKRIAVWEEWCRIRHLPKPRLRLQRMKQRWGSAGADGVIRLNPELIRAPSTCIDYVILHEICHLKHLDHGPAFRRLLQQLCPGWRKTKAKLEQFGA